MIKSSKEQKMPAPLASFKVDFDREDDGRWIAEIPKLKGVMAYGSTKKEALQHVYAIARCTVAHN